ncbi:PIN domain-containing protein [Pararhodobacter sp. CCB-MM2]|uniref:PIN domain-containing protein n=1 Tax=Pararhodobacter sp. CCB-MM2 TaxID=1786003 RepID=UPI000835CE67|nr:PIN domain-containing protein [Pararhodobacter sp. CCB-MM2]
MSGRFFDTNIILYLLDDGPKRDVAEKLIAEGGAISVQVLNEVLVNCLRKAKMTWDEAGEFLDGIREICSVVDLTPEIHDIGRALGARYQLAVYDAMIVAAALQSGATQLISEDMHHGLVVEASLVIDNPFLGID